jgi:hypothetical protein
MALKLPYLLAFAAACVLRTVHSLLPSVIPSYACFPVMRLRAGFSCLQDDILPSRRVQRAIVEHLHLAAARRGVSSLQRVAAWAVRCAASVRGGARAARRTARANYA